jgi:hypothetical protein
MTPTPECCYCGGAHEADNCPTTYTPITDCEHKDAADGCCHHPKNMTPECHVGACPRLHRRIYDAWAQLSPNIQVSNAGANTET